MPHNKEDDEKFEAEQDVRTLIRAGEIKKDKLRMKRAMKMAEEQAKALKEVKA